MTTTVAIRKLQNAVLASMWTFGSRKTDGGF